MKKILLKLLSTLIIFSQINSVFSQSSTYSSDQTSSFFSYEFYTPGEEIYSPHDCYTILEVLGEGAFGKVYAVENSEGAKFALKCYKCDVFSFGTTLYNDSKREFQVGQLLNHPNIVKSVDFFNAFTKEGIETQNLILEYIKGETLYETAKNFLSREESFIALAQAHHALTYALSLNLMHLDLHAGNVMLTDESNLMIIDLASFISFDELFTHVKTTTAYPSSGSKKIIERLAKINSFTQTSTSTQLDNLGNRKVKEFFLQNPTLFNALQKAVLTTKPNPFPVYSLHTQTINSSTSTYDSTVFKHAIEIHYFDKITNICMTILEKSNLQRNERINLRVDFKKLTWNFQEDMDEGIDSSIQSYLDQLAETLPTAN